MNKQKKSWSLYEITTKIPKITPSQTWKKFSKIETLSSFYNVGGYPYNRYINQKKEEEMTEQMPDYNPATGTFGEYDPNATPTEDEIAKAISHPVLTHLNKRLETLQNRNAELEQTTTRLRDKYRSAEYSLEALLKELLDDEEISIENAQRIADIFDSITLTKQIEVSYTLSVLATIEVPYGADEDDVASSTYVERVEFYTDFENAEVLESDHEIEDWRVR